MSVCLVMIVKDEAPVIRRCLESVLPFIDAWVIADTGSSDETQTIVRDVLAEIPGKIVTDQWHDFATNRNQALRAARGWIPSGLPQDEPVYTLTIDADEVLLWDGRVPEMIADAYTVDVEYSGTRYRRTALFKLDSHWEWVGPVHELLVWRGEGVPTVQHLDSPSVKVYHEGARSREPETYAKDAALLTDALTDDPENARYQFYLAESLRFAGDIEAACHWYGVRRDNLSGWDQERFWSSYQLGILTGDVDHHHAAYEIDPRRAEPLIAIAEHHRVRDQFRSQLHWATMADHKPGPPDDALFSDLSAYGWRLEDQLCMAYFYTGDPRSAEQCAGDAVRLNPNDLRLRENLRLCREALE